MPSTLDRRELIAITDATFLGGAAVLGDARPARAAITPQTADPTKPPLTVLGTTHEFTGAENIGVVSVGGMAEVPSSGRVRSRQSTVAAKLCARGWPGQVPADSSGARGEADLDCRWPRPGRASERAGGDCYRRRQGGSVLPRMIRAAALFGTLTTVACAIGDDATENAQVVEELVAAPAAAPAAPGDLDPTFDGDGKVTTPFVTGEDGATAVAIQADGKIVAAGYCSTRIGYEFCLARYAADGSLDPSFGSGGKVSTPIFANRDVAYDLLIQPDGKLVAAGSCDTHPPIISGDFCLARFTADGRLDGSFGNGGVVATDIATSDDAAHALAAQADGRLVAAGSLHPPFFSSDFFLARYATDGSLDGSFGQGGTVTTDMEGASEDFVSGMAIQGDGKIVAAGSCSTGTRGVDIHFCLARYATNGSLDGSFGQGGRVITPIGGGGNAASALDIQGDGKIVVGGSCSGTSGPVCLARYDTDGSLDGSFGQGGIVSTDAGALGASIFAVDIQAGGKIVAGGACVVGSPYDPSDFCLIRFNPDGSLDGSFGSGGVSVTSIGGNNDAAYDLALQGDGKIVAAGFCAQNFDFVPDFCLARFEGD